MGFGDWLNGIFGSNVQPQDNPKAAFTKGQADTQRNREQWIAGQMEDRKAIQANGQAQQADYQSQQDALQKMQDAASGNAPSAAAIQMQQGTDAALRAQMAGAASAKGGALQQALAGQSAQQQGAIAQQQNVSNTGALRAQEMAQARGAYGDLASQMRGQSQQWGLGQGQLAMQSRTEGDQARMQAEQLGEQYQELGVQGNLGEMGQAGANQRQNAQNAQATMGGLISMAGMAVGSDARMKSHMHALTADYHEALAALHRPLGRVADHDLSAGDVRSAMHYAPVAHMDAGDNHAAGPRDDLHAALSALHGGYTPVAHRDAGDTRDVLSDARTKRLVHRLNEEDAALSGHGFHPGMEGAPYLPRHAAPPTSLDTEMARYGGLSRAHDEALRRDAAQAQARYQPEDEWRRADAVAHGMDDDDMRLAQVLTDTASRGGRSPATGGYAEPGRFNQGMDDEYREAFASDDKTKDDKEDIGVGGRIGGGLQALGNNISGVNRPIYTGSTKKKGKDEKKPAEPFGGESHDVGALASSVSPGAAVPGLESPLVSDKRTKGAWHPGVSEERYQQIQKKNADDVSLWQEEGTNPVAPHAGRGGRERVLGGSADAPIREAVASDERTKRGIDHSPMVGFMRDIHPFSYEYKNAGNDPMGEPGAHRVGIIAQEAARDPVGSTMVEHIRDATGQDRLGINMKAGLSVALASIAALQEELDAVKKGKRRG